MSPSTRRLCKKKKKGPVSREECRSLVASLVWRDLTEKTGLELALD